MKKKIILLSIAIVFFSICNATLAENLNEIFTNIYVTNFWKYDMSVSGHGSELVATQVIRKALPKIFKELEIKTLLDAPCGDFWWMKEVDLSMLDAYIGADIVKELIAKNNKCYKTDQKEFIYLNIVEDTIPTVDCILCRDCLVHLTFEQINKALINFKKSNAKYLLATTYPHLETNKDLSKAGDWRPLNLQQPPFNFPSPKIIFSENYKGGGDADKHLALWELSTINL